MSMTAFIRASFAFLITIIVLYIMEITVGSVMDSLYIQFYNLLPVLPMTAGWKSIATGTLGGWVWYYRAFPALIIAIGVWVVSVIVQEIDYSKRLG